MNHKKVQAILIKDSKILVVQTIKNQYMHRNYFITGVVNENESAEDAIKRELKEQLDLHCHVTFQFSKEIYNQTATFLIDLSEKEMDLNYDTAAIKNFNKDSSIISVKWIDLREKMNFEYGEIQYIKLLAQECMQKSYTAPWFQIIENAYYPKGYLSQTLIDTQESISTKIKILFASLLLGFLYNFFFIEKSSGVSTLIFNIVFTCCTLLVIYPKMNLRKKFAAAFFIPAALLSAAYGIYTHEILRSINTMLVPALLVSCFMYIRYDSIKQIDFSFIISIFQKIFPTSFSTMFKSFRFTGEIIRSNKDAKGNTLQRSIIIGLLASIPLLFVILALLASADMVFNHYIENIVKIFSISNLADTLFHIAITFIVSLYTFGFLWSFKYENPTIEKDPKFKKSGSWEPITLITIIFVLCSVYLLFSIVQFSYLYGNGSAKLPMGFSYAEYARKGFFQLIVVTLINFILLILSIRFSKKGSAAITRAANLSYSLLIGFTYNMLFSAYYKLNLYEKAFGYTRLRISVEAFMILLGLLLTIVLVGIWKQKFPVLQSCFIVSITLYVLFNYINIDKIIAKNNIVRYQQTQQIDVYYLQTLSYDASEELIQLLNIGDAKIKAEIQHYIKHEASYLHKNPRRWYEYNYYSYKFLKLIQSK